MEYLLGSLITLITIFITNRIINKSTNTALKSKPIFYSQSVIHSTLAPLLPSNKELLAAERKSTQSKKHMLKNSIRVLLTDDRAYWIKDNIFYTAEVINGLVQEETTNKVDIMGMDDVQLKEMSFIVEKLTEGIDDENRYSGQ
jgi:hypothetical protein